MEASVLASEVVWWNEALLGAKAAAEPAERKRMAVESFMVLLKILSLLLLYAIMFLDEGQQASKYRGRRKRQTSDLS